ncbi:MAG: hypothetical protein ABGZ23_27545 [Fuerstiella sp.]|nr:hypothetical protein [Fuerstiella sp.]
MKRNAATYDSATEYQPRRGFVLAVVTIAIVLLSLAAYNYSGTMLVEHEAAAMGGRDVTARTAAESAIEYAATRILERDYDDTVDLYNDPDVFRGQLLRDSSVDRGRVRYTIIAPDESNSSAGGIRFGLGNENAKFNINRLLELDTLEQLLPEEERLGLVYMATSSIPNMTDDIIDAILDWLDTDEDRRPGGAESNEYEGLSVPYPCKNGPMDSIDELLKVQGVTPDLFYGEDANHNGILDANENDGEQTLPFDNADGILDLGWKDYLTARSRERNTTPDGEEKININMGEMTELYDAIEEEFGAEAASYIVAIRLAGTEYMTPGTPAAESGIQDQISRNDIDLTVVSTYQFTSIYQLIGGPSNATKMLTGVDQSFESPWPEDSSVLLNVFPDLEKMLTTTDDAYVEGRININQARLEVLTVLPGLGFDIPADLPDSILGARPPIDLQSSSSNMTARHNTAAWILAEGLVDLETLRTIGPYITTGGDVYRFQAIGHFDAGGPSTRLEAMIDATEYPPRIMSVRDLTSLGRGYHPSILTPTDSDR